MDTIDLIKFAAEGKPAQFQNAFNELMGAKVVDLIDAKRVEVAQNYFNNSADKGE